MAWSTGNNCSTAASPAPRSDGRLRSGVLTRIHRGVYALGGSAAANLGLRPSTSGLVAVTVPGRASRKPRQGITVHRCAIHPWEIDAADGIPTTTVARTLIDLAEQFPARVVEKAITRAEQRRSFNLALVEKVIAAHPHRIGAKRLRRILSVQPVTTNDADEGIEELFLAIVETDGRETHLTPTAFENDHAKANELTLARYTVLSFTYLQLTERRDWIAAALTRAGVAAR
jgi:hypothetical protein